MKNFTVLDSVYGNFVVNRYCHFQAEALVKTGKTHIEAELNNMRAVISSLPHDCVIVDGGANIGFVSIPLAQFVRAKGGKVIAFEPQRMIFNALAGTVALNDQDNVFLHNLGLSNKQQWVTMPAVDYGKVADFGMVSLTTDISVNEPPAMRNRTVQVVPLDSFELSRLDFFKLDVEGYEVPALQGALATIKRCRPWLWVEYWICTEAAIKAALADVPDYEFFRIDALNMLCAPKEKLQISGLTLTTSDVAAKKM